MMRLLVALLGAAFLTFSAQTQEEPRMTLSEAESASAVALVEARVADISTGTRLAWRTEAGAQGTVQFEHLHSAAGGPLSICRGCTDPCRGFQLRRRTPEPRIGYFGLVCRKPNTDNWEVVAMRGVFRVITRSDNRVNAGGQAIDPEAVPQGQTQAPTPAPAANPAPSTPQ